MRLLFAAAEVLGFAKTGGLADVTGSLPPALAENGHECAVIVPLYRCVRLGSQLIEPLKLTLEIPIGDHIVEGRLWRSTLPGTAVPVYLVEQAEYYERDNPTFKRGLYTFTASDRSVRDYPDNCERFTFFCRAVLEAVRVLDFWPDVLHAHDWQAGLVPVYLTEVYHKHPDGALRRRYLAIKTLFTIHNIAYQGAFPPEQMPLTGLDWRLFNYLQLEAYGRLNFLKAALVFSNLLNTVSPTYAREIQTPYYGCGLHNALRERSDRLFGIVNGVDYNVWKTTDNPRLPASYSADAIEPGKPQCKEALQQSSGMNVDRNAPLFGVVARLAEQKGIDLVARVARSFLQEGCQLVVLGDGDPAYKQMLYDLRARFPDSVSLTFDFDEALAHRIEAGADMFLMPSLFEPSGLNQLYSMRYGTLPVVRATGGLADTVVDTTPATLANDRAMGFSFGPVSAEAFAGAIRRALDLYRNQPGAWRKVMRNAMRADWSWQRSAAEYERLYKKAAGPPK
jgi:starch synthase